jgi:hypothetical protein
MIPGRLLWFAAAACTLVVGATATTSSAGASTAFPRGVHPDRACYKCLGQEVTALSTRDAWVAGFSGSLGSRTTWMRKWNGRHWHLQATQDPGTESILYGVSAVARDDAWTVGYTNVKKVTTALIEHWDGSEWTQMAAPDLGTSMLYDVAAISADDVWAVGDYNLMGATGQKTLILHYDGSSWTQVSSDNPQGGITPTLTHISADSPTDAWAIGTYSDGGVKQRSGNTEHSFMMHWDGESWTLVPSPARYIQGISAINPSDVWAVGSTDGQTDTEHWDGASWTRVSSPDPGGSGDSVLLGVGAHASNDVWAVGTYDSGTTSLAMILHWDGSAWSVVNCPSPDSSFLSSVSADASNDAWAIGIGSGGPRQHTLIEHWDGTSWTIS